MNLETNTNFHGISAKEALDKMGVDRTRGLSENDAQNKLGIYGLNKIEREKIKIFKIFIKQLKSPFIYVLSIAMFFSFIFGENIDGYVIVSIILINSIIGFVHEIRTQKEIKSLREMSRGKSRVWRDGVIKLINSEYIVPGDIVLVEEGDQIPADGRIIESMGIRTVESALTGESVSVSKNVIEIQPKTPILERNNMLWAGTIISGGKGRFLVTGTGSRTFLGQIAGSIKSIKKESSVFWKKTEKLSKLVLIVAIFLTLILFLVGISRPDISFKELIIFSLANLVALVPEGMIAILSIILAIGASRLAKRNAVMKDLQSIETLGAVTTIVTDKTGTLTENVMMIERIIFPNGRRVSISGSGWIPKGEFSVEDEKIDPGQDEEIRRIIEISSTTSSAEVREKEDGTYEIIGEPTEAAFWVLREKAGMGTEGIVRLEDPPFDSNKKTKSILVEKLDGKKYIYTIGAPENVLKESYNFFESGKLKKISSELSKGIHSQIKSLASDGLRTIGVSFGEVPKNTYTIRNTGEIKMTFLGVIGMKDPVRKNTKEAIEKAKKAGIRIIMATGDHKETAKNVAVSLGLINKEDRVVTGEEINLMSEEELFYVINEVSVFARVNPKHKLEIAKALQKQKEVVAMTGDGINDAPAIKQADIGISMGQIGTDVAREASQMVLVNDDFGTIISGVEEGRIVYNNIKRTSIFLLSTNLSEGLTILGSMIAGLPLVLLPTQILFLNLATGTIAGLPLSTEPKHHNVLKDKPKQYQKGILSADIVPFFLINTIFMFLFAAASFYILAEKDLILARTMAFSIIAFSQMFNVLNLRSFKKSIFQIKLFSNKYILLGLIAGFSLQFLVIYNDSLREIFELHELSFKYMIIAIVLSVPVLLSSEMYKLFAGKIWKKQI